jgi:hypothetical protein
MAPCLYSVEARLSVPFSFYHRQFNSIFVSKTYTVYLYTYVQLWSMFTILNMYRQK